MGPHNVHKTLGRQLGVSEFVRSKFCKYSTLQTRDDKVEKEKESGWDSELAWQKGDRPFPSCNRSP